MSFSVDSARALLSFKELSLKWAQRRELHAHDAPRRVGVPVPRVAPVALTFEIGGAEVSFGLYQGIEGASLARRARFTRIRYRRRAARAGRGFP